MFKIINKHTGETLGIMNELLYIKYDENSNTFMPCLTKTLASGIAVDGIPYNINDEEKIKGADFAIIEDFDGSDIFIMGKDLSSISSAVDDLERISLDQDNQIVPVQEVVMDQDNQILSLEEVIMSQDNQILALEEALMELDNQITVDKEETNNG